MKQDRNSFILYCNYEHYLELLSMEERGQLMTAIFAYVNHGEEGDLPPLVRMAFLGIRDTLARDRESYEEKCRQGQETGKRGGRPRKQENTEQKGEPTQERGAEPTETENKTEKTSKRVPFLEKTVPFCAKTLNDNDNDIDIDIDNDIGRDSGNGIDIGMDSGNGKESDRTPAGEIQASWEEIEAYLSAPPAAPQPAPRLSEAERKELNRQGIPESYVASREDRAVAYAAEQGRRVGEVLYLWWQQDQRNRKAPSGRVGWSRSEASVEKSYDTDDFFQAALDRTYAMTPTG